MQDYFNAKYVIINGKILALFSRNRSAVLTYIYIHTSSLLEREDDWHTPIPTLHLACTNTYTSRCALLLSTSMSIPLHTYTSSCLLEIGWGWYTHTHTRTHTWLLAQTYICLVVRSPFIPTERFFTYTHAALQAICVLISSVWDDSS